MDQERLGLSTTLLHIAARVGAIESTKVCSLYNFMIN